MGLAVLNAHDLLQLQVCSRLGSFTALTTHLGINNRGGGGRVTDPHHACMGGGGMELGRGLRIEDQRVDEHVVREGWRQGSYKRVVGGVGRK